MESLVSSAILILNLQGKGGSPCSSPEDEARPDTSRRGDPGGGGTALTAHRIHTCRLWWRGTASAGIVSDTDLRNATSKGRPAARTAGFRPYRDGGES